MSFEEFLLNSSDNLLHEAFCESLTEGKASSLIHSKLWDKLKEYYVVGGMPGVVSKYFCYPGKQVEGMLQARHLQQELLRDYQSDFSKHSGKVNALHISAILENIPIQLASHMDGSVQRFRFKDVIPGKQGYAALEGPIDWLLKAGLVYKVPVCQKAQLPLKAFTKPNIFKLFLFDVGLLGCMLELDPRTLVLQDYGLIKGFFAENYVACELTASGERQLYSWSERNSEIEFIKDLDGQIVPIEVKAGTRTKAQSMRQYITKYAPPLAVMVSGKPLSLRNQKVLNYPLYDAGRLIASLRRIRVSAKPADQAYTAG